MQFELIDDLVDELIEDPCFTLFVQDGYAVLCEARVTCSPRQEWRLETGVNVIRPGAVVYQGEYGEEARDYHFRTGECWFSSSAKGFLVEGVVAFGPFNGPIQNSEYPDQLREGASDLRERLLENIRGAFLEARDPPVNGVYADRKVDELLSVEAILQRLLENLSEECSLPEGPSAAVKKCAHVTLN